MHVTLEKDLYFLHRLPDDNEDNAPFQIDPLVEVQGKQIHRLPEPPVDGRTLWLLLPDQTEESSFILSSHIDFLEYTYLKLPLLRSFYYTHG